MEIVYNIVIPIITSIIGGLIGGLFTFLGVKMTIIHEQKIRDEEKAEKTKERNKQIILTRPEMTHSKNQSELKEVAEFCLLPFIKPKLNDENEILFDYSDDIFKEEYWDKYEFILQNTGKREIISAFLHIPYKNKFNIYSKTELKSWQKECPRNYYSDKCLLPSHIRPNEKIKIIVYFPKTVQKFRDAGLDLYFSDEDKNYWHQSFINDAEGNESKVIAPDTYFMHYQEDYNFWFVYETFYHVKDVKKCFNKNLSHFLNKKERKNWERTAQQDKFVSDVQCGKIALKYKLPLENKN